MRCACVDIGSNTARLLVADVVGALPREVLAHKVHTHLGRALRGADPGAPAAVAAAVADQVARARAAGAERVRVVATSALRESAAGADVCAAVHDASGIPVDVLTGEQEAGLAFLGATRTAPRGDTGTPDRSAARPADGPPARAADGSPARAEDGSLPRAPDGSPSRAPDRSLPRAPDGSPPASPGTARAAARPAPTPAAMRAVGASPTAAHLTAVVDVGGGSTELAVGPADGRASWTVSLSIGSGRFTPAGDPPSAAELAAIAKRARAALATVEPPAATRALAVGGSAASLTRIAGPRLDTASVAAAVADLTAAPAAVVAARTGLLAERVRLLPAGLLVLAAAAERLGLPLELGCGGLREGVCLELADDNQ